MVVQLFTCRAGGEFGPTKGPRRPGRFLEMRRRPFRISTCGRIAAAATAALLNSAPPHRLARGSPAARVLFVCRLDCGPMGTLVRLARSLPARVVAFALPSISLAACQLELSPVPRQSRPLPVEPKRALARRAAPDEGERTSRATKRPNQDPKLAAHLRCASRLTPPPPAAIHYLVR